MFRYTIRGRVLLLATAVLVATAGCAGIAGLDEPPNRDGPGSPAVDGPSIERTHTVTVTRVVDGDTMEIRFRNGSTDTIRLLGVDTPEVHTGVDPAEYGGVPDNDQGRAWLERWGNSASKYAKSELAGERVTIAFDRQSPSRGSYDRLLVYVYLDNETHFNKQLLVNGYARLYDSEFGQRTEFVAAEATAQSDDVGVWGYTGENAHLSPHPRDAVGSNRATALVSVIG
jgi:micrococcal nuclease